MMLKEKTRSGRVAPSLRQIKHRAAREPGENQFVVCTLKVFSPHRYLKAAEALKRLVDQQKIRAFYGHPRFRGRFFLESHPAYVPLYTLLATSERQLFTSQTYFINEKELVHNVESHHLATRVKQKVIELRPGLKVLFKPPGAINLAPKLAEIQELQGDLVVITMLGPKKFPLPVITSRANIVSVVDES